MLKIYAVLFAALSWLCAPALFNPCLADRALPAKIILRHKYDELLEVARWSRTEWQGWYLQGLLGGLRDAEVARALDDRSGVARRGCGCFCCCRMGCLDVGCKLARRALGWLPWAILAAALLSRCQDHLVHIGAYFTVVTLVHLLSPSRLQALLLALFALLYYALLQISSIHSQGGSTQVYLGDDHNAVPPNRLKDMASVLLALTVWAVAAADIALQGIKLRLLGGQVCFSLNRILVCFNCERHSSPWCFSLK